jgi:hypothetical protein
MWLLSFLLGVISLWSFVGACVGLHEVAYGSPDGTPHWTTFRATVMCGVIAMLFAYLSGLAWRM